MAEEKAGADTEALEAAANVSANGRTPTEIELPSGIKLHLKKSPPFVLQQAVSNLEEPKVPMWTNPDKGREEENPNDPDYRAALLSYHGKAGAAALNALLLFGVEVLHIPKGVQTIEDTTWSEELAFLNMPVPDDSASRVRKLMWLKTVALDTDELVQVVSQGLFALQGLSEEDVQQAIDSFRSGAERGADNGRAADEGSTDGHNVSDSPPRPRRERRRTGRRKT